MKTGRRIANPQLKALAATHRKDRHGDIAALSVVPSTAPIAPSYLTPAALIVWNEELHRVIGTGITESDSSLFARYCTMEAAFREAVKANEVLKAAMMTELRRMAELLGIAGLRSRLAHTGTAQPKPTSPFAARPR